MPVTIGAEISREPQIIPLSAKSAVALRNIAQALLAHVERHDELALPDLAYTLQLGREAMPCRLALVVNDTNELIRGLLAYCGQSAQPEHGNVFRVENIEERPELLHLFSGEPAQLLVASYLAKRALDKIAWFPHA